MLDDPTLSSERLKELLAGIDPEALQQVMPLTGGVITMMFTDIVNSTGIKAEVGDQLYFNQILKAHHKLVRECIKTHNGRELKTIGDSFFVAYGRPDEAVACAVEIQKRLLAKPIPAGSTSLQIRIGLHTGIPIVYLDEVAKKADLSGTDVDKAARVEALAVGGQVLISEESKVLAKPKEVRDWGIWGLKGLGRQGPHRIFEVLWPAKIPRQPRGHPKFQPVRFLTDFVGREAEISQVMEAVRDHRLVTLRGMGGIGKTRLANEVALRASQSFDDGVFFVELEQTKNSPTAVASELATGLKVDVAGFADEAAALKHALANIRALVVLDNFEAVISAASLVGELLKKCAGLQILATSQNLLGVAGEQQIEVEPVLVPTAQPGIATQSLKPLDSFQLFQNRARLKKLGWEPSAGDAPVVAEILEATDGIPLSIELAAARVGSEPLGAIRDGLKKNRMRFLKQSGHGVEQKRHASIQACIDWSFQLLPPENRVLFPQLSVFAGGFFAGDVASVCGIEREAASDELSSIEGASLLVWEESLGDTRYRMLPTVRDYALEKLRKEEKESLRRKHSAHFLEVLNRAGDQVRGNQQMAGFARITADLDNIRTGMETALYAKDHQMIVRYSQAFGTYLRMKGRFAEALARAQQGLAAAQAQKHARLIAGCQGNLGNAYHDLPTGDRGANLQKAIECYEAALRVYTERDFPVQWAKTQNNLGGAYWDLLTGDRGANHQKAIACYEAALRAYTERDFPVDWAMTQNNLGTAYGDLPTGDRGANLQRAIEFLEAALRVYTECDFPVYWAITQNSLGNTYGALPTGDRGANLQKAIKCYQAALRVFTERDFPVDWAMTQNNLGEAYRNLPTGDRGANIQKAIGCYEAALQVFTERDFPVQWATTQNNLGAAYQNLPTGDRGANLQKAIECYEAALRVYTERDFPVQWAKTQNNLGIVYRNPPTGDRGANLQKAIAYYEAAIRGFEAAGLSEEATGLKSALSQLKKSG